MKFLAASTFLVTLFVASNALFVWEHIWVGDRVVETHSTRVEYSEGSVLYDVLVDAQSAGSDFYFSYGDDPVVATRFGRHYRDQENNIDWVVFGGVRAPDMNNPPGLNELPSRDLLQPVVDGLHYLFWLRTDNLTAV